MEALWSRFIPAFEKVTELLQQGEIGELEAVQANFILSMGDVKRLSSVKYGGGITLDIGVYTWHAVLAPLNFTRPTEVKVTGRRQAPDAPDRTVAIALRFPNDVIGNILISSHGASNSMKAVNHVLYIGRKGYIKVSAHRQLEL
jgi:dihydrodiol dehydrogenase / D-xylose 1-dehydrogenase (NADP)